MSQKKYPENEPSNERSNQSETPINEPINERSSQSGTQGSQRSGQNPMPTGTSPQNKCEVCGQTFSNQNELNDHCKTVHKMEAPAQQSQSGSGSSSSGSKWSGQGTENQRDMKAGNQNNIDTKTKESEENKASMNSGSMGSQRTQREATKEEAGSMNKGNETSSTQSSERDIGSQKQMQNQYKCQRCGQILSNQNDLNQHNKSAHNIEPAEMGKEHEEKKSMTK
jgi:uncharacterized C2H2 Zn-finger protein